MRQLDEAAIVQSALERVRSAASKTNSTVQSGNQESDVINNEIGATFIIADTFGCRWLSGFSSTTAD